MKEMYKFQNDLPALPVPKLSQTVELYLKCLKPLVNRRDYEKTQSLARQFLTDEGLLLQNKLLAYRKSICPNSWLMPYSRDIYLTMRDPITLAGNYLFELAPLELSAKYDYLDFVAVMAHCMGLVFLEIVNETLPPMTVKGTPLCMKQFAGAFRGTKIPGKGRDEFVIYKEFEEAHSFGVFYKNKYYAVRLIDENTQVNSCGLIRSALARIYDDREEELEVNFNTAAFAGSERAAELIQTMCENIENEKNFQIANQTLFNITLSNFRSSEETVEDKLYTDTKDIWPYKQWSITVYQDKICSFNFEHTCVDGLTNVYMLGRIIEKIKTLAPQFTHNEQETAPVMPVIFNLNDKLKEELLVIKKEYINKIEQFSSILYVRQNIPVKKLKEYKINVDVFLQLAFQYAQWRAFREIRSTHESVSVAQYYEGRTSCIRSASEESTDFVKALAQDDVSCGQLMDLFSKANQEHLNRIGAAKDFCCFIRHAAGLNIMCERFGAELGIKEKPAIFTDSSFLKYCTQQLSTSSLGNTLFVNRFAFAPQTESGLGIGYITHNDVFIADISFYKNEYDTIIIFKNSLDKFFDKMENLFEARY